MQCNAMLCYAGSRLERMGSTMTASMNQTMSNISSQMISPEQLEEANKLAKVRTYMHMHMCAVIEYCDVVVIGIGVVLVQELTSLHCPHPVFPHPFLLLYLLLYLSLCHASFLP
jgi:hypothetical protein